MLVTGAGTRVFHVMHSIDGELVSKCGVSNEQLRLSALDLPCEWTIVRLPGFREPQLICEDCWSQAAIV